MPLSNSRSNLPSIGVALAFYAFIAIGIAEGGLGVLLPSILTAYNLTPATVTLLFLSQITGYIVAALASSLLNNCMGLAWMLLIASATLTTALVVYALTPLWSIMVACGALLGLGIGLIDAGINTYIVNDQRHAHLIGFLHAFYGVGALLGPAIATTLLNWGLGWRLIYLVFAAIASLTVAGTLWAVMSNYPLMNRQVAAAGAGAGTSLRLVLRTPAVLMAGLLLLVYVGTEASLGSWAYSVQTISRGTPELLAGYGVSAYWLGLTVGRLGSGRMVQYLGAIRTLDCSLALLTVSLLLWWLLPHALWSLLLIGFALAVIFPLTIWLLPQRISAPLVPAAIGFLTSIASLGAALIPTGLGWIAARGGLEIIPVLMLPLAALMIGLHHWLVQYAPAWEANR